MGATKKGILEYLTGWRDFLRELIGIVKSILNLIWNNKIIVLLLCIFYLIYLGLNHIAYEMPKKTIINYYSLIDNKKLSDAWVMLTPQCQIRWKNGKNDFIDGYATLATTKILNIENFNSGSLTDAITSDKKQLIVDIVVLENFRWQDIVDTVAKQEKNDQKENSLWLRLKHKELQLERLKADSLPSYRSALKLVRRYRKVFTIQKNPNADLFHRVISDNWLISDIDNKEIGIIFDTTFYYK